MIERLVDHGVFPPALLATGSAILASLTQAPWLSMWGLGISTCWLFIAVYDRYRKATGK